jgi:phosphoglycerol transferase MdoB-like AlkP superfamily enzyme
MSNLEIVTSEKRPQRRKAILAKVVTIVALCLLLTVTTWIMDRASIKVQLFTYVGTYGFFINAIPGVLIFLLLLSLFNRVVLSLVVTFALTLALYVGNYLKLKYLDVPISFSDIYLLENLHVSTLELLVNFTRVGYLIAAAVFVVVVVGGSIWLERAFFRRRSLVRAALAAVVLFFMISLGAGARWVGGVYGADKLRVVAWAPVLTILHSGVISAITFTSAERTRVLAVPVDQPAIDKFIAMDAGPEAPAPAGAGEQPDIVMIQSESFFDPALLKVVDNTDRELPNLHRALASGIGGTMKAPTFGGGTLRTEFEVLTGIPMAAYPDIEFPYLQITRKIIPSLIHLAHQDGYATVAIHGNSGLFWNREKAFKAIGFDKFITAKQFPVNAARDGWYFSDSAMTDQIIDQLDQVKKPILIFAISLEGHGPYLNGLVDDKGRRDSIPAPPGLAGKSLLAYRNYMYHIEDADQQMGRLWKFLAARQRPYVLVFYGDHLPPLQRVYSDIGFDDDKTGPEEWVPWFIVGSQVEPRRQHITAWMMGSEVLRASGLAQTPYYQLIAKAERALDQNPGAARQEDILQGIYSLSRLHLEGKLAVDLKQVKKQEGSDVAATRDQ